MSDPFAFALALAFFMNHWFLVADQSNKLFLPFLHLIFILLCHHWFLVTVSVSIHGGISCSIVAPIWQINTKLGVMLWQQSRAQSRSKHMYYLFALSLSNGLSAELRAHFYDTIAQKHLSCLYFFFTSLLLVIVHIVFTLPSSFHS